MIHENLFQIHFQTALSSTHTRESGRGLKLQIYHPQKIHKSAPTIYRVSKMDWGHCLCFGCLAFSPKKCLVPKTKAHNLFKMSPIIHVRHPVLHTFLLEIVNSFSQIGQRWTSASSFQNPGPPWFLRVISFTSSNSEVSWDVQFAMSFKVWSRSLILARSSSFSEHSSSCFYCS